MNGYPETITYNGKKWIKWESRTRSSSFTDGSLWLRHKRGDIYEELIVGEAYNRRVLLNVKTGSWNCDIGSIAAENYCYELIMNKEEEEEANFWSLVEREVG